MQTINYITNTANSIMNNNTLPPNVKSILNKYGGQLIYSIEIQRTPINQAIQSIVYNVSQQKPYDKLFHLRLNITTDNGVKLIIEKNERVNMAIGFKVESNSQLMNIENPPHISVDEFINNCIRKMGNSFYTYSASSNNCQVFCMNLLISNGIERKYLDFIKQNTQMLFKNENFRKFANTTTDIAGVANKIVQGGDVDYYKHDVKQLRDIIRKYKNVLDIKNLSKLKKKDLLSILESKFKKSDDGKLSFVL